METPVFQAERFKKLIEAVERAPDEGFDMYDWAREEKNTCGTAACACGWYAIQNPSEGFTIDKARRVVLGPDGSSMGIDHWATHFGIEWTVSRSLFTVNGYRTLHPSRERVLRQLCAFYAERTGQALATT